MVDDVKADITKAVENEGVTPVQKWLAQFAAYDRQFSTWEARVDRILKRYRDEQRDKSKDGGSAKFNILWSNVQTLVPAVYAKTPKPDVSRRFRDNDPVGRVASLLLERTLEYEVEQYPDFRNSMRAVLYDRFLGGRGTVWARYEPHILAKQQAQPTDGVQVSEDVGKPNEELDYECAPTDYVPWKDFGHSVARTWDEVTAVWRKTYLTRQACIDRFGDELGQKIPLDCVPDDLKKEQMGGGDGSEVSRAMVYEVWDKQTLKAIWICPSMPDILDERDDPLELEGFWPCPKPLYATMTNESLVPVPDFSLYQDQAKELDTLADRIQGLINSLQIKGVYDASIIELARIFTEGDNGALIPVKNWQAFAEKNGLAGAIDIVDLKPIYEALKVCYDSVQQVLQQVYDLTGISDIIRGASNANETATAQRIKGQYASLRLKSMQQEVAQFASQALQLKAQIICGNYAHETILKMAAANELKPEDQQLIPQAMALLIGEERMKDPVNGGKGKNPMRSFRIEVNANTMVEMDEEEEKAKRIELVTALGTFFEKSVPMVQASPAMAPVAATLLKFVVTAFKAGKTIEGELDSLIDQAKQLAAQPQQPKPDPEMERVKADKEIQQARVQADMQTQQQKIAADREASQMKLAHDREAAQLKLASDERLAIQKMQFDQQTKQAELQHAAQVEEGKRNLERETADKHASVDREVRMRDVEVKGMRRIEDMEAMEEMKEPAMRERQQQFIEQQSQMLTEAIQALTQAMDRFAQSQEQMAKTMSAPKRVVRGPDGRAQGVEVMQ